MDFIDGSGLWVTGDTAVVPPIPPASTGDGVMLTSSAYSRRYADRYARGDPWAEIIAWWRRLRRIDAQWDKAQLDMMIARDDAEIIELTQLMRGRRQ